MPIALSAPIGIFLVVHSALHTYLFTKATPVAIFENYVISSGNCHDKRLNKQKLYEHHIHVALKLTSAEESCYVTDTEATPSSREIEQLRICVKPHTEDQFDNSIMHCQMN